LKTRENSVYSFETIYYLVNHQKGVLSMQKWEYMAIADAWDKKTKKFYWVDDSTDKRSLIERLGDLGEHGWELAAVLTPTMLGRTYILKRSYEGDRPRTAW
jgi:hypothetical protein